MSVINQVLNQLEQRGAQTKAEQDMVRAVIHSRHDFTLALVAVGLVLIASIVVWQWALSSNVIVPTAVVAKKPVGVVPVMAAALSVPAVNEATELPVQVAQQSTESESLPSSTQQDPERDSSGQENSPTASRATSPPVSTAQMVAAQPESLPETKITNLASTGAVAVKTVSTAQLADAEFRRAVELMQLGRIDDAISGYEAALQLDAGHDAARQALVALFLEGKRNADAEKVLLEGLNNNPEHLQFIMLLARLQVERGAIDQATDTLQKSLPFAGTQADYLAFLAALLQRQDRNEEAIQHYQIALQHVPDNGIWLMGYALSLQAMQRNLEAKDIFQRALDTKTLAPELQVFVQQKLKGL